MQVHPISTGLFLRSIRFARVLSLVIVIAVFALSAAADVVPLRSDESDAPAPKTDAVAPAKKPSAPLAKKLAAHFKVLQADAATDWRYIDRRPHDVSIRDLEFRLTDRVQFQLDPEGKTYVQARGETGSTFATNLNSYGVALNPASGKYNVKTLFFGQSFGHAAEFQAGGLEFDRGAGSEATYADNDGYLVGYRLRLTPDAATWLPAKISVTTGDVGDFYQLNVFSRFHNLSDPNYLQILAQKKLREHVDASVQFDRLAGIDFVRGALTWTKVPGHKVDDLTVEAIGRTSDNGALGWAASAARSMDSAKRWNVFVRYSQVPASLFDKSGQQVLLNGDAVSLGKRVAWSVRRMVTEDFEMSVLVARRLDDTPGTPRWRAQLQARYQFTGFLNHFFVPSRTPGEKP